ncbi:MAG TPA: coenzyme F420-0:L-glutamate ligase [Candidatus Methanofastidiosa archaeon]|nr:coenzyme F420-0:L-glutamate ligase [Candidatus Methanofastidiosa archaeon]HPR40957.1 coenzyme F420-0:L-glutamate ligase [Candidatus Methanofastidiosa archaeon]
MTIQLIPVGGLPLVKPGDNIPEMITAALNGTDVKDNDVFVIASTIISKAEGQIHDLRSICPSEEAEELSLRTGKDPRLCEVILRNSRKVIKVGDGPLITQTPHGFICASSGVDTSNIAGDTNIVATLPLDPDASARSIRMALEASLGKKIVVLISDTHGRPFRSGAIGVCIGLSGMDPFYCYKGEKDLYGYELRASIINRADEITSAADMVMGQSNTGYPVVIVRGSTYFKSEDARAVDIVREEAKDLFR